MSDKADKTKRFQSKLHKHTRINEVSSFSPAAVSGIKEFPEMSGIFITTVQQTSCRETPNSNCGDAAKNLNLRLFVSSGVFDEFYLVLSGFDLRSTQNATYRFWCTRKVLNWICKMRPLVLLYFISSTGVKALIKFSFPVAARDNNHFCFNYSIFPFNSGVSHFVSNFPRQFSQNSSNFSIETFASSW